MQITGEGPRYEILPIEPRAVRPSEARPGTQPAASAFAKAFKGLGGAIDKGEALIAGASRGNLGGLDSGQLIALQAGIYRYSEAVDLVAKLVDRASTAVKTVISPH